MYEFTGLRKHITVFKTVSALKVMVTKVSFYLLEGGTTLLLIYIQ
jgi:hypothetical protein